MEGFLDVLLSTAFKSSSSCKTVAHVSDSSRKSLDRNIDKVPLGHSSAVCEWDDD